MSFSELLDRVASRPAMYITERSAVCLKAFLDGWAMGSALHEASAFLSAFQSWIQSRYQITSTQSWAHIIAFHSPDQFGAFEESLRLMKEFRGSSGLL